MADVGVVVGELARLRGDRVGDLGAAIADVDAVEPGEGVEEALAVAVLDVDAGAAGDDPRGGVAAGVLGEVRRGVEEVFAVPERELVVGQHVIVLVQYFGSGTRMEGIWNAYGDGSGRKRVSPSRGRRI